MAVIALLFPVAVRAVGPSLAAELRMRAYDMSRRECDRVAALDTIVAFYNIMRASPSDYLKLTWLYRRMGEYRKALAIYDILLARDGVTDDLSLYCHLIDLRGEACMHLGDYVGMLSSVEQIVNLDKPDSLLYRDAAMYLQMTDFHASHWRLGEAIGYLARAEEALERSRAGGASTTQLNDVGFMVEFGYAQIAICQGEVDEAIHHFEAARRLTDNLDARKSSLNTLAAHLFKIRGKIAEATAVYDSLLYGRHLARIDRGALVTDYVRMLLDAGDAEGARRVRKRYTSELEYNGGAYGSMPWLYYLDCDIEHASGNDSLAILLFARGKQIEDSIRSAYQAAYTKDMGDRFEMRRQTAELQRQRDRVVRRGWIVGLLVATVGLLGLAIWLLRRRYLRRGLSLDISETRVGDRDSQLSAARLHLEALGRFERGVVAALSRRDLDDKAKIAAVTEALCNVGVLPEPRHLSPGNLCGGDTDVVSKLRLLHPDLSNSELRIAPLVLMNLSNKDISSRLNRSLATVKSTKYSLRKKLGITMPTEQYLREVSALTPIDVEERVAHRRGGIL